VRFRFIEAEKAHYPVTVLCRTLEVSRAGFYAWRQRRESRRAVDDRVLRVHIRAAFQASRSTYGSPRIRDELVAQGQRVGRRRVARLMRLDGLQARKKRRFRTTTDSKHSFPVADNLLGRQFSPAAPNRAWVSDITYVPVAGGWLYLAVVMDLYARRVVGWALEEHMTEALVLNALQMALRVRRPAAGLLHHSDRGSQYASDAYQLVLRGNGVLCSMSRKGNCWDNAPMESFFSTLKIEWLRREAFVTAEQMRASLADYLESFYNRQRRHSYLAHQSPVAFEQAIVH
jgi:putative transposase